MRRWPMQLFTPPRSTSCHILPARSCDSIYRGVGAASNRAVEQVRWPAPPNPVHLRFVRGQKSSWIAGFDSERLSCLYANTPALSNNRLACCTWSPWNVTAFMRRLDRRLFCPYSFAFKCWSEISRTSARMYDSWPVSCK